jgi:hypothetical protein
MTLQWATLLLEIAAATTSVVVAHKKRSYRPVALFLCIIASADLLRLILLTSILRPALEAALARGVQPADVPFTGLARAAGLADRAFFLLWPAGFAALAVRVFLERSPWPVAIVYAIAVSGAIWGYPEIRGSSLRSYYLAAEIAALTVATGSAAQWLLQRRGEATFAHASTLVLCTLELITLFGPYPGDLFSTWATAQAVYAVLYASILLIQAVALWKSRSMPGSR